MDSVWECGFGLNRTVMIPFKPVPASILTSDSTAGNLINWIIGCKPHNNHFIEKNMEQLELGIKIKLINYN